MADCVNELAHSDPKLGPELIQRANQRKAEYAKLLQRAQEQGLLDRSANVQTLADMLYTFLCGLSTYAKLGKDEQAMKRLCDGFLKQMGLVRHT